MADNLHVVTGGPGSGKTTLVEALAGSGMHVVPEAGRRIIRDQVALGGRALPWGDRLAFAELMLQVEIRAHRDASARSEPVILDRALPDVLGYLVLCGLPVPKHVEEAASALRYNRRVFVAPHWPAIFRQDAERKQTLEEAEATYEVMKDVYTALGYELVPLPLASVAERVRFVREQIGTDG